MNQGGLDAATDPEDVVYDLPLVEESTMIRITLLSERGAEVVEVGRVEFLTLLVQKDADYRCNPEGILSYPEIQEICRSLRQLPQINTGRIGRLRWTVRG